MITPKFPMLSKQEKFLSRFQKLFSTSVDVASSSEVSTQPPINIPKRIERTSVDILKALSNTVGKDPTAAHYMYYDDPYLYPSNYKERLLFAMSKESGVRTAHWVMEQHPDLFQHNPDDPIIEKFLPKAVYDQNSEGSQELLKDLMSTYRIEDAIVIYENCIMKNIEINDNTQQELLELVCFYNCEDIANEGYPISQWFGFNTSNEPYQITWKNGNFAEELFSSMKVPTSAAYCALICGMAKHNSVDKAFNKFTEAKQKNIELDTNVYNALLRISHLRAPDSSENNQDPTLPLLKEMSEKAIPPNVYTINSVLEALHNLPPMIRDPASHKVIAEFRRLGVKFNLSTYYWINMNFCYKRKGFFSVIRDIMKDITFDNIEVEDYKDCEFLPQIMNTADRTGDWGVALSLEKLLNTGDNYKLLNMEKLESAYYTSFLNLASSKKAPDEFIEMFRYYVPSQTNLNGGAYRNIVRNLTLKNSYEYIPEILSNNTVSNDRATLGLTIAITKFQPQNFSEDVKKNYATVIKQYWHMAIKEFEKSKGKRDIAPDVLNMYVKGYLKCCNTSEQIKLLEFLKERPELSAGTVDEATLTLVVDTAVEKENFPLAFVAIHLWQTYGYEDIKDICEAAEEIESLTPLQKAKIKSFYVN